MSTTVETRSVSSRSWTARMRGKAAVRAGGVERAVVEGGAAAGEVGDTPDDEGGQDEQLRADEHDRGDEVGLESVMDGADEGEGDDDGDDEPGRREGEECEHGAQRRRGADAHRGAGTGSCDA